MSPNQEKPVVHFSGAPYFENWGTKEVPITVAHVYALDHPRLGRQHVRTSQVLHKFEDGSFETMNTLYKPEAV